ncbi:MAG: hypothetical protein U1E70_18060 [Acetobacteraceae bacterium]
MASSRCATIPRWRSAEISSTSILNVDAGNGESNSSLTVTGTLTNNKTVQAGNSGGTKLILGGLVNPSGKNFTFTLGTLSFTGGPLAFTQNGGAFALDRIKVQAPLAHSFTNEANGVFTLRNNTTLEVGGDFLNENILNVDAGNGESNSSLTVTGTLTNNKTVQAGNSGGTKLILGGLVNPSGKNFTFTLGTLSFTGGPLAFTQNGGAFALDRIKVQAPLAHSFTNEASGVFTLRNNTTLEVGGDFLNENILNVDAGNGESNSSLTVTGTLTNNKTVQAGNSGGTKLILGGLVNANGANFNVNATQVLINGSVTNGTTPTAGEYHSSG